MKSDYIQQEAKVNFKDWTVHGLVFLLSDPTLSPEVKAQIRCKLDSLRAVEP